LSSGRRRRRRRRKPGRGLPRAGMRVDARLGRARNAIRSD